VSSLRACRRTPSTNQPAGFPDPFAVATINGEQTKTTGVIKKTLNPYWNESFDMYDDSSAMCFRN
jgi:Ca2+-dependent lipid-binding protein